MPGPTPMRSRNGGTLPAQLPLATASKSTLESVATTAMRMVNENDGTTVVTGGVYLKVDPHHRLEFAWGPPGADPDEAPIITLSLEPVAGGTSLTLELRGVHGTPGDGFYYDGMGQYPRLA